MATLERGFLIPELSSMIDDVTCPLIDYEVPPMDEEGRSVVSLTLALSLDGPIGLIEKTDPSVSMTYKFAIETNDKYSDMAEDDHANFDIVLPNLNGSQCSDSHGSWMTKANEVLEECASIIENWIHANESAFMYGVFDDDNHEISVSGEQADRLISQIVDGPIPEVAIFVDKDFKPTGDQRMFKVNPSYDISDEDVPHSENMTCEEFEKAMESVDSQLPHEFYIVVDKFHVTEDGDLDDTAGDEVVECITSQTGWLVDHIDAEEVNTDKEE